jgi:hypothetical protein
VRASWWGERVARVGDSLVKHVKLVLLVLSKQARSKKYQNLTYTRYIKSTTSIATTRSKRRYILLLKVRNLLKVV